MTPPLSSSESPELPGATCSSSSHNGGVPPENNMVPVTGLGVSAVLGQRGLGGGGEAADQGKYNVLVFVSAPPG